MRKKDKYILREKKIPYYQDEVLTRNHGAANGVMPGVSLKVYEVFDGKDVKWGVREEYISIFDDRTCKSTPLFENMIDEYGYDKNRVIYLEDSKFLLHGKLNGSEVLAKINSNMVPNSNFVSIENFGGEDVRIREENDDKAFICYKENGFKKCMYFDLKEFRPCSSIFDAIYADNCFLKSYVINGEIRAFVGKIHSKEHTVKSYGFDINRKEYFLFPLDENGLIDEEEMLISLYEDVDDVKGFNKEYYKNLDKRNLITLLLGLEIDGFKVVYDLQEKNMANVKRK